MEAKKTSLYEKHLQLNAKMGNFANHQLPLQYTSVKNEVNSVRTNAGIFDVSHMGEFFIEGPDAEKFVDYIITNNFLNAGEKQAVYSPICREDGTVVDDAISYKLTTSKILICVNATNMDKDWNWFNKHIKSFDCTIINRSSEYSLLAVQGPNSESIFSKINILPEGDFPYYSVRTLTVNNQELIISRTGYTGEDGFEVFCSHELANFLWEQLVNNGVEPCGLISRDVLRLEVCFPLYGNELTDNLTPLDCGLKWTVKLGKNKFIGQEALANYSPQYRLIKLSTEKAIPRSGYEIMNESSEVIGKVVSGTMSTSINFGIATGLVDIKKFPCNRQFYINIRSKKIKANYHTKPFVVGGHK